ncbi:hypothetical protein LINPERPRIM_LOCUS5438 [Linum perenne]
MWKKLNKNGAKQISTNCIHQFICLFCLLQQQVWIYHFHL